MAALGTIQPDKLFLGSASPRRRELLQAMGLVFEVLTADIDETYPKGLKGHEITDYLARKKAAALSRRMGGDGMILTADTVVWFEGQVQEKPANGAQARQTLQKLSGNWHEVITSVCFSRGRDQKVVHAVTEVKFARLDEDMINTYFQAGNPMDKAGAYGIQEWIGLAGVEAIRGSYTNVVGLPTQLVYKTLRELLSP